MNVNLKAVLIFAVIAQTSGWRPFKVEVQNLTYKSMHSEIIDLNITMHNKSALDAYLNVLRDVSQLFVDVEDLHDSGGGIYNMVYMNKTIDVCQFLNNRKSTPLFDIIYRIFSDYGDLPKKCPIRRQRYDLLNVVLDAEKYPPFLPDHKAKITGVAWSRQNGKKIILGKFSCIMVIERTFKSKG